MDGCLTQGVFIGRPGLGAWSKSAAYPHTQQGELRERHRDDLLSINPRERPWGRQRRANVETHELASCGNQIRLKGATKVGGVVLARWVLRTATADDTMQLS